MRVLSDISEYVGSEFQVDDVDRVLAVRFSGVFCDSGFRGVVSGLEQETPLLVKQRVSLYDDRISGTHAYEVFLVNGDMWNIPIW